jgi:type VI secretion system protein ImpH
MKVRAVRNGHVFTEITSSFLGLSGSVSPLATFATEELLNDDDKSVQAFYDIFHHRIISLFYRSWKKYRPWVGYRTDATDIATRRALSFVGVDAHGAIPKHGLPASDLLGIAPLLALRTRTSRSLQIILEDLLKTNVKIESFVSRRILLDDSQRARMGQANATLGRDMTVGRSTVDRSGRFRVIVGPLNYELFETLMPAGRNHLALRRIVDQFTRGVLEVELELRLSEDQTPRFCLGSPRGSNLGTTTTVSTNKNKGMRVRILLSASSTDVQPMVVDESSEPNEDEPS